MVDFLQRFLSLLLLQLHLGNPTLQASMRKAFTASIAGRKLLDAKFQRWLMAARMRSNSSYCTSLHRTAFHSFYRERIPSAAPPLYTLLPDSGKSKICMPALQPVSSCQCGGVRCITYRSRLDNLEALQRPWCNKTFKRTHIGHAHHHDEHTNNVRDDSGDAGVRVSRLGLIADICLTVGKAFCGYISGSAAVAADAAHSMSDIVLSGVALWTYKVARAPKDKTHPFGHGKFESLGALGVSSMLVLTGGGIAWHSFEVLQGLLTASESSNLVSSLQSGAEHAHFFGHTHSHGGHQHGIDKEHQILALSATMISILVKEGLYWVTKKVGDAYGSELLKANAWHHRSDAISSVVALIGVGGAMLGLEFLDPIAGLFVSGMIIRAGIQSGYRSLQDLVDSAVPDSVLASFKETVLNVPGVKGCDEMRGRRAGSSIHLDVHIKVDPWLSVSAAHRIGEAVRQGLQDEHPLLEEVCIHIEPAEDFSMSNTLDYNVCDDAKEKAKSNGELKTGDLPQQEIEKALRRVVETEFAQMIFERMRCHFLQGHIIVELEVSMDPTTVIRDAKEYVETAERKILETYPRISAIDTQLRLTNCISNHQIIF